jgi:hypothetical protein
VVLREFEMVLQNNLATDTHRAARYAQFVSLLKEVNRILEQKEAARILAEVRKLPSGPSGLADLLAEFLDVKGHAGVGRSHELRPCPERACSRHHETGRGEPRRFHWGGDRAPPRLWIQANARVPGLAATG